MEYMVLGEDGQEYGPANVELLREWAKDDRVRPNSELREALSGVRVSASQVPGLFPPAVIVPEESRGDGDKGILWRSLLYSVLAVIFFFVLQGIGLIFAAYAGVYAFQAKASGNRYGIVAIAVAGLAIASILIGWYLRFSSRQ